MAAGDKKVLIHRLSASADATNVPVIVEWALRIEDKGGTNRQITSGVTEFFGGPWATFKNKTWDQTRLDAIAAVTAQLTSDPVFGAPDSVAFSKNA